MPTRFFALVLVTIAAAHGASKASAQEPASGTIIVSLPGDAKIYFDGAPTKQGGPMRVFTTPPVQSGKDHVYELKVEVVRDGKTISETVDVPFRGGATVRLDLSDMSPEGIFIRAAVRRLSGEKDKIGKGDLKDIADAYDQWNRKKDEESWRNVVKNITLKSQDREITSIVTIKTIDTKGRERRGDTIRYRLAGLKGESNVANHPTTVQQEIVIGYYNIWAERGDKALSSRTNKFSITKKQDSVTIVVDDQ